MRSRKRTTAFLPALVTLAWFLGLLIHQPALAIEPRAGLWSAGAGAGVLGDTTDGTAFALNLYAERFIDSMVSIGPLVQIANFKQIAVSIQPKYWIDVTLPTPNAKMNFQAGLGFVHGGGDTSYVIPLGIGVDYPIDRTYSFTMTLLLNFTGIDGGLGSGIHLMPGLNLGVRF
jgi:hypothetical protein